MVPLTELWLPILVSTLAVFFVSFLVHMVLPWHRRDYSKLPDEDKVSAALKGVPAGSYALPCPTDPQEMGSAEMQKRYAEGPAGFITIFPLGPPMGPKELTAWFVFCGVVGVFAAYLTGRAFGPEADYLTVFRFAGTATFLGHAATHAIDPIWKGGQWPPTFRFFVDALVYALLTGGIFGWLWP